MIYLFYLDFHKFYFSANQTIISISISILQSLLNAVYAVVKNISLHADSLTWLPPALKDKIIHLLEKRGTLTDNILELILHGNVRNLDLAECDVSDVALQAIGSKCQKLRTINLNSQKEPRISITNAGIQSLAEGCKWLQTVYLWRCINITDDAIIALAGHCPNIRELNIGSCGNITDASLRAIGEHCTHLKCLDFSRTNVSDAGVLAVCEGECRHSLQEVHMKGCRQLSDEAVEALIMFCAKISILIFDGCPLITERSRLALDERAAANSTQLRHVTWSIY